MYPKQMPRAVYIPLFENEEPVRQTRSLTSIFSNFFSRLCSCCFPQQGESIPMRRVTSYGALNRVDSYPREDILSSIDWVLREYSGFMGMCQGLIYFPY